MLKLGRTLQAKSGRARKSRPAGVHGDLPKLLEQAFDENDKPNELGKLALQAHAEAGSINKTFSGTASEYYVLAIRLGFKGHFRQWFDVVMWADWK